MNTDNTRFYLLVPISIALGVMLSPESLVVLGNGMGSGGALFLIFVLLAVFAHFLTVVSYDELLYRHPGSLGESNLARKTLGSFLATILPLSSKVLFALCASAGILTTAGYVFNEVFLYWFPNLGFSFCLLALLLVINLIGRKVATAAQITFVTVSILGLAILIVVGSLELGNAPGARSIDFGSANPIGVAPLGLLLFVGHELAFQARNRQAGGRWNLAMSLGCGVVLIGVILSAWGLVSFKYVGMENLAGSTIPHMVAARKIFGQHGRIVMGMVVVAGALSAVNGLLFSVSRILSAMAREGNLPSLFCGKKERATAGLLFLVFGIAAVMGLGLAGEPVLEIYTRAGILFWLLTYTAVHLALLGSMKSSPLELEEKPLIGWHPLGSVIGLIIMLGGLLGLLWTDPNSAEVLKSMLIVSGILSILTAVWVAFKRRVRNPVLTRIEKERANEKTHASDIENSINFRPGDHAIHKCSGCQCPQDY